VHLFGEEGSFMNNLKSFRNKLSITGILSLGFLILGIGFICLALIHIREQAVPSLAIEPKPTSSLPTLQLNKLSEVNAVPAESIHLSNLPKQDEILYSIRPEKGDNIGSLTIPALNQVLPIIHGADEDELKKGVGHFAQSVLPGEANNSVLSGHRDTVFRKLGKLKIGDQLITKTSAGTFTYVINLTRIVHKDDKSVIVPTDHAVLTVTTCYPFYFVGDAPDRYIITADLVKRE
jgi:sortase A